MSPYHDPSIYGTTAWSSGKDAAGTNHYVPSFYGTTFTSSGKEAYGTKNAFRYFTESSPVVPARTLPEQISMFRYFTEPSPAVPARTLPEQISEFRHFTEPLLGACYVTNENRKRIEMHAWLKYLLFAENHHALKSVWAHSCITDIRRTTSLN